MPDHPSNQEVIRKLVQALDRLVEKDLDLLKRDLNERTITHKLAEYLQDLFPEWHVDCEYNRNGHDPKRIHLNDAYDQSEGVMYVSIFPDIIVHIRGTNNHNLLIIEAKKMFDQRGEEGELRDRQKLLAYADAQGLNYQVGAFVLFGIRQHAEEQPYTYSSYYDSEWHEQEGVR